MATTMMPAETAANLPAPDAPVPFDLLADLAARLLPSVAAKCGMHGPDGSCVVCLDTAEAVAICSLASIA